MRRLAGLAVAAAVLAVAGTTSGLTQAGPCRRRRLPRRWLRRRRTSATSPAPAPPSMTPVDVALSPLTTTCWTWRATASSGSTARPARSTHRSVAAGATAPASWRPRDPSPAPPTVTSTSPTPRTTGSASTAPSSATSSPSAAEGTGPGQFTRSTAWPSAGPGRRWTTEVVYTVDGDGRIQKWTLDGTLHRRLRAGVELDQPAMAEVHPVTHDLWVVSARDRQVVVIAADGNGAVPVRQRRHRARDEFMGDPRGSRSTPTATRVYVSDEGNHRVQVFNAAGRLLTAASSVAAGSAVRTSSTPAASRCRQRRLVVADEWDFAVKEFRTPRRAPCAQAVRRRAAALGGVNTPRGLAVDADGRVFVSDWWNQRIQRWASDGTQPSRFGFRGTIDEPGSINFAWDVAVQPGTGRVFVANRESHEIEVFTDERRLRHAGGGVRGTRTGRVRVPAGRRLRARTARSSSPTPATTGSSGSRSTARATGRSSRCTAAPARSGRFDAPTGITVAPTARSGSPTPTTTGSRSGTRHTGAWTAFTAPGGGQSPTGALGRHRRRGRHRLGDRLRPWPHRAPRPQRRLAHPCHGARDGRGPLEHPFDVLPSPTGVCSCPTRSTTRIIELRQ